MFITPGTLKTVTESMTGCQVIDMYLQPFEKTRYAQNVAHSCEFNTTKYKNSVKKQLGLFNVTGNTCT